MDIPQIDVNELEEAIAGGAHVVDVREADEFAVARIPGVSLIPLSEFEARVGEIPKEGTTYFVCARGGRSLKAAEFVQATLGIKAVNVDGGIQGWLAAGKPVESDS